MKRFAIVVVAIAALCVLVVGWAAPSLIAWYFTPPVEIGVTCKPAVVWAIDVYRKTLLAGAGGGFLLGVVAATINAQLLKASTPKG